MLRQNFQILNLPEKVTVSYLHEGMKKSIILGKSKVPESIFMRSRHAKQLLLP